jgi:metallo-beta-lactamase family protein
VHQRHPECYDAEALERLHSGETPFSFPRLRYITEVEDSKALNPQPGPMVIISASGMCEGGRILHHLKNTLDGPDNIVLFVGYQAEHTLGRRLIEGVRPIRIFGEEQRVRARIEKINALSAHADRTELLGYHRAVQASLERAFVVHGEVEYAEALADGMRQQGIPDVVVPHRGQEFTL